MYTFFSEFCSSFAANYGSRPDAREVASKDSARAVKDSSAAKLERGATAQEQRVGPVVIQDPPIDGRTQAHSTRFGLNPAGVAT